MEGGKWGDRGRGRDRRKEEERGRDSRETPSRIGNVKRWQP